MRNLLLVCSLTVTCFTLLAQPANDNRLDAIEVTHTNLWVSADAAYTNVAASADGSSGCAGGAPSRNVWFKFQATTNEVEIRLHTGGIKGTLNNPLLRLNDASGNNMICYYNTGQVMSHIQSISLTIGSWYFISVDNSLNTPGTFTLEVRNQVNYDLREKAIPVPHSWLSGDAAYSNEDATRDGSNGCAGGTPSRNVWFKFQATTNELEIRLRTGGVKGTLTNPLLRLNDASGNNIICHYNTGQVMSHIQSISLTIGSWYFISIDNTLNTPGTFTLEVRNQVNYDFREKAIPVPHSWISGDGEYSNADATRDGSGGCTGLPSRNVWFKFQATSNQADILLYTGGAKGTLSNSMLRLNDESGNFISCSYNNGYTTSRIQSASLTLNAWYYVSVDNFGSVPGGTFTLEIKDDVGFDLKENAETILHAVQWCSEDAHYSNVNATPDGNITSDCGPFTKNVWFRFKATSNSITIRLLTGSTKGTLSSPTVHLLSESGSEMVCSSSTNLDPLVLNYTALQKGNWYYIVVDNSDAGGTFTLCVEGGTAEINSFCKDVHCDGNGNVGVGTLVTPHHEIYIP